MTSPDYPTRVARRLRKKYRGRLSPSEIDRIIREVIAEGKAKDESEDN